MTEQATLATILRPVLFFFIHTAVKLTHLIAWLIRLSGHSARGLARSSLQLSRAFSTSQSSASLSKRLRKQWRGSKPSSQTAASSPQTSLKVSSTTQAGSSSQPAQSSSAKPAGLRRGSGPANAKLPYKLLDRPIARMPTSTLLPSSSPAKTRARRKRPRTTTKTAKAKRSPLRCSPTHFSKNSTR